MQFESTAFNPHGPPQAARRAALCSTRVPAGGFAMINVSIADGTSALQRPSAHCGAGAPAGLMATLDGNPPHQFFVQLN